MTSSVSICSNALIMLGDRPISSFEDGTNAAKSCANLYPFARDEVLRSHTWNSATKRLLLSPLTDAPAFDYRYAYQLPSDWLRTIQIGQLGQALDFTIEGRQILTDSNTLPLVYIYRNAVEATWDPSLISTATYYMKAMLAYAITQSASMAQVALQEFLNTFRQAKAINGQDDRGETLGDFPLLESRLNGYYSGPR